MPHFFVSSTARKKPHRSVRAAEIAKHGPREAVQMPAMARLSEDSVEVVDQYGDVDVKFDVQIGGVVDMRRWE